MDEKELQSYIDWAKRGNLSGKSAANYFELAGLSGEDFKAAMSQVPIDSDPNVYVQEKKPKSSDPYAGFQPIEEEQVKGAFDNDLEFIEPELIKTSEEEAVGLLRNKYNRYGFKFNESVPGFDFIKVTAPNGEQGKFQFGREMSESDQQYFPGYERSLANNASELISFMNKNMIEDSKKINDLAKSNYLDTPKYLNKEDIEKNENALTDRLKGFQSDISFHEELTRAYDVAVSNGEQESANKIAIELRDSSKDLENTRAMIEEDNQTHQANIGSWYSLKSNQGTWVGAAMNLFGEAVDGVASGFVNEFMDAPLFRGVSAAEVLEGRLLSDQERRDRKVDYTAMEEMMKLFSGTTDEYVDDLELKASMVGGISGATAQASIGLVRSAPAFLAPGKVLRVASMASMVLNETDKEMSGPEFKDVSEDEKWLLKAPLAVTTAVLEEIGFRNATQIKTIAPKILMRALGKTKAGTKIPAKTLAEYIEQDVKNSVARGSLAIGSAFFAEAETGLLQEISATEIKRLWNFSKDRFDFDVPSTTKEYFSRAMKAAYMEGVGGFVLGGGSAVRAARNSYSDYDHVKMMIFSNKDILDIRKNQRRMDVALGKISSSEAAAQDEVERKLYDIAKQVPEDASISVQKQIFRKLQKEAGLKDSVARKGARMASREQKELDKVRKEIDQIGGEYEVMTPEQKEKEVQEAVFPTESADGKVTVETADGSVVEIEPQEVEAQEASDNEEMEEAPQEEEGQQLSLFDESEVTAEAAATEGAPIETEAPAAEEAPVASTEEVADFAEIEIDNITPEALSEAGFSTEYQSIINRVTKAVGGIFSRGKGSSIRNHRTKASLDAFANEAQRLALQSSGKENEFVALQYGEFIFGFVEIKNGQPTTVHLLDTNSTEFTESVKEAATKLGGSYRIPSATDLVSEELITHYMLYDFFGPNGTKREEFFNELESIADDNPALRALIARTRSEYSDQSEAKQQEEVIAAFFIDYRKSKDRYRGVVQRIIDWFNSNFRKGTRVINNEQDLFSVANQVVNILQGRSVKIDSKPSQQQAPDNQQPSLSRSKGDYNYLKNETIYYDFDRQSGKESDYNFTEARGKTSVPQKINVNDFFHFRNWYNKITANQEYPGIVTNMYFIKDGKKHTINPPKPKVDREGNKVRMDRIPTFKQIRGARRMRDQAIDSEVRVQYSELSKEVGDLWQSAGLNVYTMKGDFYPEGSATSELDFEGLIIAKKNIQAVIDAGITKEQLKEMKTFREDYISKEKNPDLFNMSGLSRLSEESNPGGDVKDPNALGYEVSFAKSTPNLNKRVKNDYYELIGEDARLGKDKRDLVLEKTKRNLLNVKEAKGAPLKTKNTFSDAVGERPLLVQYYDAGGDVVFELPVSKKKARSSGGIKELNSLQKKAKASGDPVMSLSHSNKKSAEKSARLLDRYLYIFNSEKEPSFKDPELSLENNNKPYFESQAQVKAIYDKLKNSNGEMAIAIALNKPDAVIYRPDFLDKFWKELKLLAKNDVAVQDQILKNFNDYMAGVSSRSKGGVSESRKKEGQSLLGELNVDVEYGLRGKVKFSGDRVRYLDSYSDLLIAVKYVLGENGLFEGRRKLQDYLNIFSGQGTDPYPGFPNKDQAKKMLVDPDLYVIGAEGRKNFNNSGDIAAVSILDLKSIKVINGKGQHGFIGGEWERFGSVEGSSFPYYISGGVETILIDEFESTKNLKVKGLKGGQGGTQGLMPSFSKASGRVSKQVVDKSGVKGVSVNQLMQIAGKGSKAEQLVISDLIEKFPDSDFIPQEEFDMFFEGKMLEPLDDSRNHSDYGLERVLGSSYRKAKSVTVPFLGDSEIYGTPGIFEDHFRFPTHAHIRMFTHPDNPGVTYVSELQSDTYQRGLKDAFNDDLTDDIIVSDYGSDEFDISVENLDLLKYIVDNYSQYRSMLVDAAGSIQNARMPKFWSDITESIESVSEKNSTNKPNIANILSNALESNPEFNVNAFRVVLRLYATSDLNAPVKSTDKQIEAVIDDAFNRYPFIQEGEDTNLAKFARDVSITIEHISDTIPDIVWDGDNVEGMTQEEREEAYGRVVEAVEENRSKVDRDIKEGVSSAKNSWEKQLIRYAIKKAQGDGSRAVRFPTEGTAAIIQWWSEAEDALRDQVPLRKRYRDLPKTLKSMGLDVKIERDQRDNAWYEIETPPSDTRLVMFSRQGKSNIGDIGGATWAQRKQSRNEELTDKWLVRFQDKYRRVFKLQEDVAKKTRGQVKESEDFRMAEERMYGRAANDLEVLDGIANKITEQLKEEGLTIAEVDEYMYALHAKERNAVISERTDGENEEGSGKSDAWADQTLLRISSDKKAKLERVAATVRNVQQMTRNTMVELGLETQETIDAFEKMFSNYVPLQGMARDEDSIDFSPYPSGGAGFSVSGATTKKAKGRKTESVDIVAQVISQNAAVNIKGRTNEAMNALFKLAENNPNQDVWTILDKEKDNYREDDPNIVSVRVNGVQKAIRFKDASYAQSLRTMNLPQKNLFVKYMGTLNSWLRAAFTSRNPEFILSNFSRDIQSAVFNASSEAEIEGGFLNGTDAMARIFKMVSPSLKALIREEVGAKGDPLIMKYYEDFKEDGGKTGWAYQKSLEDIASDLEIDDSGKTGAQKVIGGVKKGLEFIEGMNDAFENSIRLSSYIAAREAGVSRGKAAQFAKNITVNFNKQGEWGAAMNATFLFFNASVQGTARLGRSLINPKPIQRPDGSNREWYERASTSQKAALGMVIMNGLLTLLNRAASDEDEDEVLFFNKIPDYVKERNMIIMRPDGENYWKIPMPYGYNIFANAGSVAVEVASGDKPALEGLAFMTSTMINAFSPISFGQSENLARMTAKSAIPTAFKPFFDAFAFNETYFGGPVMAEQYPFGTPKPKSSMSFRSPEELKQFFSWVNEATGGSEKVPGVIDVNPDGGWYIMEYFMGGTGKFVERSIETGRKIAADTYENPVDLDFNDVPFLRILYGEPSKYYDMQKFKEREVEIKQLVSEYKSNRVEDPGNRYKSIGPLDSYLKKINKALKVVRAEKRSARKIRNYEERVSKVQALMERERKIVMMFNKQYDELRGED